MNLDNPTPKKTDLKKILCIDDDKISLQIIAQILIDDYDVIKTQNAKETMLKVLNGDLNPDVILLEVIKTDCDCYEFCRQIKANSSTKHIVVIFISNLSSFEDQVKGLEAGADGYIPKPYQPATVLTHILTALETKRKIDSRNDELKNANQMTMTALSTVGETGSIFKYFRDLNLINDYSALLKHMLALFSSFQLDTIVCVRHSEHASIKDSNKQMSELELSIFQKTKSVNRVIQQHNHYYYCKHDAVAVLIRNMPIDDEDYLGRMKDYVNTVTEGTNAAVDSIKLKQELVHYHAKDQETNLRLNNLIATINLVLENLETLQESNKESISKVISKLISEVENAFFHMGLTESQEQEIIELLSKTDEKLQHTLYDDDRLSNQIKMLEALINL